MENSKIVLYKKREFGDVFNVSFAFIKQEFKPLGRAILVFILPIVLIQGVIGAFYQTSVMDLFKNPDFMADGLGAFLSKFLGTYLVILVVMIVGQTMLFSTIISYLKLYKQSEDEITIASLANEIKKCFFPVMGALFLSLLVIMVGFVCCIIPGIYLGVSLSVFLVALVIEQKGIGDAFSRSFQLVKTEWWGTFLLIFVTIIILYILIIILQIPAMVMGFSSMFHSIKSQTNPFEAFGTGFIIYTTIVSVIQQIISVIPIILLAFQYFSLVEITDKPSLNEKIEAIGQNE